MYLICVNKCGDIAEMNVDIHLKEKKFEKMKQFKIIYIIYYN